MEPPSDKCGRTVFSPAAYNKYLSQVISRDYFPDNNDGDITESKSLTDFLGKATSEAHQTFYKQQMKAHEKQKSKALVRYGVKEGIRTMVPGATFPKPVLSKPSLPVAAYIHAPSTRFPAIRPKKLRVDDWDEASHQASESSVTDLDDDTTADLSLDHRLHNVPLRKAIAMKQPKVVKARRKRGTDIEAGAYIHKINAARSKSKGRSLRYALKAAMKKERKHAT